MRVPTTPLRRGLAPAALLATLAGAALAAPIPASTSPAYRSTSLLLPPDACTVACTHAHPPHPLMQAVESLAAKSENPDATRSALLDHLRYSPTCYAPDLTPEQFEALMALNGLRPAGLDPSLRYFTANTVWFGDGQQDLPNRARAAHLTYSFPDDGVTWGLSSIFPTGPNNLNAMFSNIFGATNIDRGRELVRQSLASWSRSSGLTYSEVADDNSPMTGDTIRSTLRGDIRIGGVPLGNNGILAYNPFPNDGSDMVFNTSSQGSFASSTSNYRFLRNVAAHEHGHGLAYIHTIPCNGAFLMEPNITLGFDMLTIDERRGAQRNYGDRFAGNNAPINARDLGDLTAPAPRSVIERDLSTNGQSGPLGSSADWFRFTIGSTQAVSISAAPTGGTYIQGQQSSGCSGSTAAVAASQAGNLNIELRNETGSTIIQSSAVAGPGQTETLNILSLAPGTYMVRIFDAGPNSPTNQFVQLYDLTVRIGTTTAPPQAVAGLDKRCRANTNCFFIGNINSRALNAGAALTTYAWDLDGDGSFEIPNNAQPNRQYISNGVYDVTLRVTDSNGRTDDDTIQLTIFGATTSVTTVSPNLAAQGQTIPVTITGVNLKNVTDASMVTVSGTGVTVSGTPVSNALGTELTGLSFTLAPSAPVGQRDIVVSNADGTGTGVNLFTVELGENDCPADWNDDTMVNSNDISAYLTAWLADVTNGTTFADFDTSGQTNSNDISAFLTAWLDAVQNGC